MEHDDELFVYIYEYQALSDYQEETIPEPGIVGLKVQ